MFRSTVFISTFLLGVCSSPADASSLEVIQEHLSQIADYSRCTNPVEDSENCSIEDFESALETLKAVILERETLRATLGQLKSSLKTLLEGKLPQTSCRTGKAANTIGRYNRPQSKLSHVELGANLLSFSYKPVLVLAELTELEHALVESGSAKEHLDNMCAAYQRNQKYLSCFMEASEAPSKSKLSECAALLNLDLEETTSLVVVQATNKMAELLPYYTPFLHRALTEELAKQPFFGDNSKALIERAIETSVKSYLEWQAAEAVVFMVDTYSDSILKALGLNIEEFNAIVSKLRAMRDGPELQKLKSDVENGLSRLDERFEQIKQIEADLQATYKKIMSLPQKVASVLNETSVDTTSRVVEGLFSGVSPDTGLTFRSKRLPTTEKDRVVYETELIFVKDTLKDAGNNSLQPRAEIKTKCGGAGFECRVYGEEGEGEVPFTGVAEHKGEREIVEFGIYFDSVWISPTVDGKELKFSRLTPGVQADTRIDYAKLNKAIQYFGVPGILKVDKVRVKASRDLKDIDLVIDTEILKTKFTSNSPAAELTLMKNGVASDPIKQFKEFAKRQIQANAAGAINNWISELPYVSDGTKFDVSDYTIKVAPIKLSNAESVFENGRIVGDTVIDVFQKGTRKKLGDKGSSLQVEVHGNGVSLKKFEFDPQLLKEFDVKAKEQLKSTIGNDNLAYIERVTPYLHSLENFSINLRMSAAPFGCRLSPEISLSYPFDGFDDTVKSGTERLAESAVDCLVEEAITAPALQALRNNGINLLGLQLKWIESNEPPKYCKACVDSGNCELFEAKLAPADKPTVIGVPYQSTPKFKALANQACFDADRLAKYITAKTNKLLGFNSAGDNKKKQRVKVHKLGIDPTGFYFGLLIRDIDYIGDLEIKKMYLDDAGDALETALEQKLKSELTKQLNEKINKGLSFESIGRLKNIAPDIQVTAKNKLDLMLRANLEIVEGLEVPIEISLIPFKVREAKDAFNEALRSQLLDLIPNEIGRFTIIELPKFVENEPKYGVSGISLSASLDLEFIELTLHDAVITSKGVVLPPKIHASSSLSQIIIGNFAIANPGASFDTETSGLTLTGDLTIGEASASRVGKIESTLDLSQIEDLIFTIEGSLVLADSLSILDATGVLKLKDLFASYEAQTNPAFKDILEARYNGELDAKNKHMNADSAISMLGMKLNETEFSLELNDGTIEYTGYTNLLIGDINFGFSTKNKFKDPKAKAEAKISIGSFDALSAKLKANLAQARFDTKVLGVGVGVTVPSVQQLSPDLILEILENLLKIDLEELLKNIDLDDLNITIVPPSGGAFSPDSGSNDSADDEGESEEKEKNGEEPSVAPGPPPVFPPEPEKHDVVPNEEPTPNPFGNVSGFYFCAEMKEKGTFTIAQNFTGGHISKSADSITTRVFGKKERDLLCESGSIAKVKSDWKFVHSEFNHRPTNCVLSQGRYDSDYTHSTSEYPPELEWAHFCGRILRNGGNGPCTEKNDTVALKLSKKTIEKVNKKLRRHWWWTRKDAPEIWKALEEQHNYCNVDTYHVHPAGYDEKEKLLWVQTHGGNEITVLNWKQSFRIWRNGPDFWALSLCPNASFIAKNGFSQEDSKPSFSLCKSALFKLFSDAESETQSAIKSIDEKGWVLNGVDSQFLISRAAEKLRELAGDPRNRRGLKYTSGIKQTYQYEAGAYGYHDQFPYLEYYVQQRTAEPKSKVSSKSFIIPREHPLYNVFENDAYEKELLASTFENGGLEKLVLASDVLILRNTKEITKTEWMKPNEPRALVYLSLDIPTANGVTDVTPEQVSNLAPQIDSLMSEIGGRKFKVTFGYDADRSTQIALVQSTLRAGRFGVLTFDENGTILTRSTVLRKAAYDACLVTQNIATNDRKLHTVFKRPSKFFREKMPRIHPFALLNNRACR